MAVKKNFEAPLQVVETKAMRDRIVAVAERETISQAQVIRDIIAAGIDAREALCEERVPTLPGL